MALNQFPLEGTTFRLSLVIAGLLFVYPIYFISRTIYNIYFHPLCSYPGPKLYAASHVPYHLDMWFGTTAKTANRLHSIYGPVVRLSPTTLSYTSSRAWREIYAIQPSKPQLAKDPAFYLTQKEGPSIFISSDADHSRMRRLLSHAFSDRAIKEQEPLMTPYFDLLITRLREAVHSSSSISSSYAEKTRDVRSFAVINFVKWYNMATFDVIGDLAFGQPFGSLETGQQHSWITMIFKAIKMVQIQRIAAFYPLVLGPYLKLTALYASKFGGGGGSARAQHAAYSAQAAAKRLATKDTDRKDFMSYILRHNNSSTPELGMTEAEIKQNAKILVLAGSETTATTLSGATYHLLRTPRAWQRLCEEVRSAFNDGTEINMASTTGLAYLNACLEEALRIYPPVPSMLPRKTPKGGCVIEGKFVPGGTSVGVNQWAASHSAANFHDPDSYIPERWLPPPPPPFSSSPYSSDDLSVVQPFSMGTRNCLGKNLAYAELRSILSRIVWHFDLELCEEAEGWLERQKVFFMWDKGGLNVRVKERSF